MNLSQLKFRPNMAIFQMIEQKTFRFGNSPLHPYCKQLALEEYKRCEELLIEKLGNKKILEDDVNLAENLTKRLTFIMAGINKLEEPIKDDLIEAAQDIIQDLYDVPEHILFNSEIKEDIKIEKEIPPRADEIPDDLEDEIMKRLLLNFIPHGSAMWVWQTLYHLIRKNIPENLFLLYEEYTAVVSWLLWQLHPVSFGQAISEGGVFTQGKSQCCFSLPGEIDATIEAEAVNFPVLLHELNKGVMDYLISIGLPSQYSPEALELVYADADDLSLEPWYYYLAPGIWKRVLDKERVAPNEIPTVVNKISRGNLLDIENYFLSLFHD